MVESVFFLSHSPQIKWYSVFAQAFKEARPGCRIVLFVHGASDVAYASRFAEYDEIVDLIDGFRFDPSLSINAGSFPEGLLQLENDLDNSFFWEDAKIDRWVRAKCDSSFTVQYLSYAFDRLLERYEHHRPTCGFGESTMAIYRLAHRLFDRDGRKYLAAISTRYFERFYIEDDWYWRWTRALDAYRGFVDNGVPAEIMAEVLPVYENISVRRRKPIAFESFVKANSKGFSDVPWWDVGRAVSILKTLRTLDETDASRNVRASIVETSIRQKFRRYHQNLTNYKDYLQLVDRSIPKDIKFCSYFLHYQPEYTVDSLGKYYMDQNYLISNIASSLPAGHYLIVKDHMTMVGLRPKAFYEHIKKNNNVILLHHSIDSLDLIERSELVFTIVGTSAIEAMFLGVPAIMFGRYAFDTTNTISLCTSFWELGDLVRRKIGRRPPPEEVRKHALALLAGKYKASWPGKIAISEVDIDAFFGSKERVGTVKNSFKRYVNECLAAS